MNKEEILALSREENQGMDVAGLEISKSSTQFGWIVAVIILSAVAVTEAFVYGRMNSGIFFGIMAGNSAVFIYKYLKMWKRHELIIAIIYSIAACSFGIAWIIQLTKG